MKPRILKNTTPFDIELPDVGQTIEALSEHEINTTDFRKYEGSQDIIPYIVSGGIVVNDGFEDMPVHAGLGLVQHNDVVLNDYYTLVTDSDVLVGNGRILSFHDDLWEYDTAQDFEEEDQP